ncbi:response regulator transcription factor [Paenibacillus melissococcoides]|uniref:Response regulator transcription factor n=1 Tax=Paenibacillus melissococcoides TaxID=2912268 RepID=A0ABM9G5I6_9BACL|nr:MULTISPECIES: response regulator transcription factor [Paenibacillus]MEB9897079.1 response regulator transcription factor [Bacillus cereus]CAH8246455.1 response regulator transcription factor [Paenibacillus melissococcoides]CAH8714797.1 response regulator transcription factor [Paenibacillus melissococcoides]CAH8715752.1 response regulator transcription factor [Paenibacillus melissococcoides]GIO82513.1 DNA-binding response regulator [Paenibacillus dendritiformis]
MTKPCVLIADDDKEIVDLIADSLEDEGFATVKAYSGQDVLELTKDRSYALLLLDIMMPNGSGIEICRAIRDRVTAPIVFITAKSRDLDKVVGFEIGADDYITKPFSIDELVARVKAHIRRDHRSQARRQERIYGNLIIDKDTYEVIKDGVKIDLSTKEFQILSYLADHHNKVLSREQIYDAVWGQSELGDMNTVTVHIKNIRNKIDPENRLIVTVWGVGYKFTGGLAP